MSYFTDVLGESVLQRTKATAATQGEANPVSPVKDLKDKVGIYRDLQAIEAFDTEQRTKKAEADLKDGQAKALAWYDQEIAPKDNAPSSYSTNLNGILSLPRLVLEEGDQGKMKNIALYQRYADYRAKLALVPGIEQGDLEQIDDALATAQTGLFGGTDDEALKTWEEYKNLYHTEANRKTVKGVYDSLSELIGNSEMPTAAKGRQLVSLAEQATAAGAADLSTKLLAQAFTIAGEDPDFEKPSIEQLETATETYYRLAGRASSGELTPAELKEFAKAKVTMERGDFSMGSMTLGRPDETSRQGQIGAIMKVEGEPINVKLGGESISLTVGDLYAASTGVPTGEAKRVLAAASKNTPGGEALRNGLMKSLKAYGLSGVTASTLLSSALGGRGYGAERKAPQLLDVMEHAKVLYPGRSWSDLTPEEKKNASNSLAEETF